jgi:hypothetical protein
MILQFWELRKFACRIRIYVRMPHKKMPDVPCCVAPQCKVA